MTSRTTASPGRLTAIGLLLLSWAVYCHHVPSKSIDCVRYLVGGSTLQGQLSGYYSLLKQTYKNRLVYRQSCSQYALFANTSSDGSTTWVIGRGVGNDVMVYIKSRDPGPYPRDVKSWLVWSREKEAWTEEEEVFIRCTDTSSEKSCRSLAIKSPDVPPDYRGPYVIDGYHDDRPRYKHVAGSYYLYFDGGATCRQWLVSHVTGRVVMQAASESQSASSISEKWRILNKNNNKLSTETYSVHIECLDYEEETDFMDSCGQRKVTPRITPFILGAEYTYPGKWPFMVSYTRPDGAHKCGGTLINKRWVLTTGHCLSGAEAQSEKLKFGVYSLYTASYEPVQTIGIKSVHIHPLFSWVLHQFRLNHDIGLIELSEEVVYTDHVQPVCLPPYNDQFPFEETEPLNSATPNDNYTNCYMIGWGKTNSSNPVGGRLQDLVITKVMSLSECLDKYYTSLSPDMKYATDVCLFGKTGGRMCKGDSGSPMVCQRGGQWYLLGLGGWSLADCVDVFFSYPSVYTVVSVYRDWIFATMYGSQR